MQWFLIVLICILALLLLLFLPVSFGFRVYFNILKNLGVIEFSCFGIPISCFQASIHELAIDIIKPKGKQKRVVISLVDKTAIFINHFITTLFRYININELSIFCDVGKKDDAFVASMIGGGVQNFIYSLYALMYSIKKRFRAYTLLDFSTQTSQLKFSSYIRVTTSLFFVLVSLIRAKLRTNRTVNVYEEFFKRQ